MYIAECNSNHDPSQATSDVDLERDENDPLEDSSSFDKLSYISNKELRITEEDETSNGSST